MKNFSLRSVRVRPLPVLIIAALLTIVLCWKWIGGFAVHHLAGYYAGKAGIDLGIGSVRGNIFSKIILEKVSARPEGGESQYFSFSAGSIGCDYDLWKLRDGLAPFIEELECSVNDPAYRHDFRVAASPPQEDAATVAESPALPTSLPALKIDNGSVELTGDGWGLLGEGIDLRLYRDGVTHKLQLNAKSLRFDQGGIIRIDTGLSAGLHYTNTELTVDYLEAADKGIKVSGSLHFPAPNREKTEFAAALIFWENRLDLTGSLQENLLKIKIDTDNLEVKELQKQLGGAGWDISGQLTGHVELALDIETGGNFAGSFDLAFKKGTINGVAIRATATGKTDKDSLLIPEITAEVSTNRLTISRVEIPLEHLMAGRPQLLIAKSKAEIDLDMDNRIPVLQLFALNEVEPVETYLPDSLSLKGRLAKGALKLDKGIAAAPDLTIEIVQGKITVPSDLAGLDTMPVELTANLKTTDLQQLMNRFGDIPLSGDAKATLAIKGTVTRLQGALKLSGGNLNYSEKEIGSLSLGGDVELVWARSGDIREISFRAEELAQSNGFGTLKLDSPISGIWQPGTAFSLEGAFLVDRKGVVVISLGAAEQKTNIEVTADSLDSDGWLANYLDHQYFFHDADLKALYNDSSAGPRMELSGTVGKGGAAGIDFPVNGKFNVRYSAKGIEISEFNFYSQGRNKLTLAGTIPYDPLADNPFLDSELHLVGNADFPALEKAGVPLEPLGIAGGSLKLDLALNGSWDHPVGHISLTAEKLEPAGALDEYFDSPINLTAELVAGKDGIVLKSADLQSKRYTAEANGTLRHVVSLRKLLDKPAEALEGEVALDASVKLKDLNFLAGYLDWLRRLEGDMQGKIHVEGPIGGPAIKGSLSLDNGEVAHVFDFPPLSSVELRADFDEHSLTITRMQAEMGGSPINMGGKINRTEERITLDLHGDGQNVLLFRNNYILMRGNVLLNVTGPLESLAIKGTTGLTYGYYTRNIDFLGRIGSTGTPVSEGVGALFSFEEPPLKDASFDIKITAIEPFRIKNNLVRGVVRPELTLKGTGELPYLVGNVYIDPSRIILPSGRLQIQSGLVRYPEEDPNRPRLDIVGRSKVLGYDINVVTSGPVSDPIITLSSNPALPNDELLLLLLTGQPPKKDVTEGTGGSGTRNVMVYLGKDFLKKWLEEDTSGDNESVLDRFELDLGRNVTVSGDQTVEATFRLSKKMVDKGEGYYLSAEKDKYDAYNYGLRVVFRFE